MCTSNQSTTTAKKDGVSMSSQEIKAENQMSLQPTPPLFDESLVFNFKKSKRYAALPEYQKKMFNESGVVPAHVADKLFPVFTPGYFSRLASRGKISGVRVGKSYFVNLVQAYDYVTPRRLDVHKVNVNAAGIDVTTDLKDLGL